MGLPVAGLFIFISLLNKFYYLFAVHWYDAFWRENLREYTLLLLLCIWIWEWLLFLAIRITIIAFISRTRYTATATRSLYDCGFGFSHKSSSRVAIGNNSRCCTSSANSDTWQLLQWQNRRTLLLPIADSIGEIINTSDACRLNNFTRCWKNAKADNKLQNINTFNATFIIHRSVGETCITRNNNRRQKQKQIRKQKKTKKWMKWIV